MTRLPALTALALLRIATGMLVFPHGVRKVIQGPVTAIGRRLTEEGFPSSFAYVVTLGELSGLLLALGLFTRVAGAAVALTMGGIALFVNRVLFPQIGSGKGVPLEFALLLALSAALFVFAPATPWSLDGRRGRR